MRDGALLLLLRCPQDVQRECVALCVANATQLYDLDFIDLQTHGCSVCRGVAFNTL